MHTNEQKLTFIAVGVGILTVLLLSSFLDTSSATSLPLDFTPTAYVYLPLVIGPYKCPETSTNQYSQGIAYQYDEDDPVRPAYNHADKNIELRGYTLNTDSERDLRDYGSDDPTRPPQLATLFETSRVPEFLNLYRVHDWDWADPPDPGERSDPIETPPVTALGVQTTPGEPLHIPESGYSIGGDPPMEVIVLFADEDTVALHYAREDTVGGPPKECANGGGPGYTVHVDNVCTDPNLLALYNELDDPDGPRYEYKLFEECPYSYDLPTLQEKQVFGTARSTEAVIAVVDTGAFMDTRSCREWWQVRPGYGEDCKPE